MTGLSEGAAAIGHPCSEAALRQKRVDFYADHAETLCRTVENEIIPRLMLLHRQEGAHAEAGVPAAQEPLRLGDDEVIEFTDQVLRGQAQALAYLQALIARGATLEALCLGVLAASARRLGDLWNADLCDFTDVTIALGRLQGLLRGLSATMKLPRSAAGQGRSALFAPAPGEQHTFGLSMVCDFFRVSGWDVWRNVPNRAQPLIQLVREQRFDLVGFSIGNDRGVAELTTLIRAVRRASKNRALRILVGGPLAQDEPELARRVGADAMAVDASQAMLQAERLVAAQDEGS